MTYDYSFAGAVAEECSCGAGTCRGVIVDLDPREIAAMGEGLRGKLRMT
jgi:hypothetical protein